VSSYPASLGDRFYLGDEKILFGGVSSDGAVCEFGKNNCRRHAGERNQYTSSKIGRLSDSIYRGKAKRMQESLKYSR
jgi:hypothetical protein